MATSLSAQLSRIAVKSSNPLDLKAHRTAHSQSLLFPELVAASQDFESLFQICYEGFLELRQIDGRYASFAHNLFSEGSKSQDRRQMTKAENEELDLVIEAFLCLVSSRLSLRPAIKSVEWLIRRFQIHEHNTISTVLAFLPFHELSIFVSLLNILPKSTSIPLKFLHPYIESRANPSRDAIVHAIGKNGGFFAAINSFVLHMCHAGFASSTYLSFWATVIARAVAEMVDRSQSGRKEIQLQQEEETLRRLLPLLDEGLTMKNYPDMRITCYMLLTILSSKYRLNTQVQDALMEAIISNWTKDTTHAALICFAVLTRNRDQTTLSSRVFESIMGVQTINDDLSVLKLSYDVNRFVLGLTQSCLEQIVRGKHVNKASFVRYVLMNNLLHREYAIEAVASLIVSLLQIQQSSEPRIESLEELRGILHDMSVSERSHELLLATLREKKINAESIEAQIQTVIIPHMQPSGSSLTPGTTNKLSHQSADEFSDALKNIPIHTTQETSFLVDLNSNLFTSLYHAFSISAMSPKLLEKFMALPVLQKESITLNPTLLSFFVRVWGSVSSDTLKSSAIQCLVDVIKADKAVADLQILYIYLIYGLCDLNSAIRALTADLVMVLTAQYEMLSEAESHPPKYLAVDNNFYGTASPNMSLFCLSGDESARLLKTLLVPHLEECRADASYLLPHLLRVLSEGHMDNSSVSLPKAFRKDVLQFLVTQTVATPLFDVKKRLLPFVSHIRIKGIASGSKHVLPLLMELEGQDDPTYQKYLGCRVLPQDEYTALLLGTISAKDKDSLTLLNRIIDTKQSSWPTQIQYQAYQRIREIWHTLKIDSKLMISETLVHAAFPLSEQDSVAILAFEVLHDLSLPAQALIMMLDDLPPLSALGEDSQRPPKRRRTQQRHSDGVIPDDQPSSIMQQLTSILEIVESAPEGCSPLLLTPLFGILSELTKHKQQERDGLQYNLQLTLSCIRIVLAHISSQVASFDKASIRADLVVDCLRISPMPQVQNVALLALTDLAIVVPEMLVHTVMPIFTFISTGTLRQTDDYSQHVIDRTIESVIPPLVLSFQKQRGNIVVNASELLLSFVAAFEHMPSHRRLGLFESLIDQLGPSSFLPAISAMMLDKYPADQRVEDFLVQLALHYSASIIMEMVDSYIDLVFDTLDVKHPKTKQLFSYTEERSLQQISSDLLNLIPVLFGSSQIEAKINQGLAKGQNSPDTAVIRMHHTSALGKTMNMFVHCKGKNRIRRACERANRSLLGFLPTEDLFNVVQQLLQRTGADVQRQALQALDRRLQTADDGGNGTANAAIAFLFHLVAVTRNSNDLDCQSSAMMCAIQVVKRYGKTNIGEVRTATQAMISVNPETTKLSTQRWAFFAGAVDVLGEEFVSMFTSIMPIAETELEASISSLSRDVELHNAVYSFLGAVLDSVPWLISGRYLDKLLNLSYESSVAYVSSLCLTTRRRVLDLLALNLDTHESLAGLSRTWDSAMMKDPREHLLIFKATIQNAKKASVVKESSLLAELLLRIFDLRRFRLSATSERRSTESEIDKHESYSIEIGLKIVEKLNDSVFRPIFSEISDWPMAIPIVGIQNGPRIARQITFFKFSHRFFDTFKSIVTSYATFIIPPAVNILESSPTSTLEQRRLTKSVLKTLHSCFEHDQDEFWQSPSHIPALLPPLIRLIPQSKELQELLPTIVALAERTSAPDQHKTLNAGILAHFRSEDARTRLAAVELQIAITTAMGDEWLALLSEMLPFIAEALEDSDEDVEMEVRAWRRKIEEILGEDITEMLQ
ncbi:snoRNA-binding rRNA-processing protein utp10 [Agyrium rufum]|nr:snoRNA-binding rRNA-processing protein utp10 [Agyrium rufum]